MEEVLKKVKSVNLPKTAFPMKAGLPQNEPKLLAFWEENDIYEKMINFKRKPKGYFILHDGPPYANGNIHLGHALNKILKDIVVKYKTMDGYSTPFIPGWDCHGLPIEHQLMKQLKTDKRGINRDEFRKQAEQFAMRFVEIQKEEFKRLGITADWDNPYLTMSRDYEYGIVKTFNKLLKSGYIYRSKKPVFWCISCETALADAEVEYEDHSSPSIFVRFPLVEGQKFRDIIVNIENPISIIIWTTTPWTLPSNVAVAVDPDKFYGLYKGPGNEVLIAAADQLLEKEYSKIGIADTEDKKIIKGSELLGLRLKHPFNHHQSKVVGSKFVQMDTGAGTIHIAPGHGLEDYQVGLENNLPVISPIDERGAFTEEIPQLAGKRIFEANPIIIEDLANRQLLLHQDEISHSYPQCWRCKHPVIYRATEQWFLSVDYKDLRKRMQDCIKKTEWIPKYGENRIAGMVETRPDWCLSRQRYWGTPIPLIYCLKCHTPVTDSDTLQKIEDVFKRGGSDLFYQTELGDFVSASLSCSKCGSKDFKKEEDILDVWFDSGVSHESVLASPAYSLSWPADMYLEGSDQHRGWFQTSLIPAVALRQNAPYKTVLTHGFTVDGQGKKMSKSQGNVVSPQEVIKDYGADILRLWVASSDYREDVRVSPDIIKSLSELYRKTRNTFRYLIGNTGDYPAGAHKEFIAENLKEFWDIDKFVLSELNDIVKTLRDAYSAYEFHKVVYFINQFSSVTLSSFYFDILKDRLYTFGVSSRERRFAQAVLWEILIKLLKLTAPIISFTSEEAYQCVRNEHNDFTASSSIFMEEMPAADTAPLPHKLKQEWESILKIREKVNAVLEESRTAKTIGSSLEAWVKIKPVTRDEAALLEKFSNQLEMIFIVSKVTISSVDGSGSSSGMEISVEKAPGEKCARCWRYTSDASNREGVHVCGRCSVQLGGIF